MSYILCNCCQQPRNLPQPSRKYLQNFHRRFSSFELFTKFSAVQKPRIYFLILFCLLVKIQKKSHKSRPGKRNVQVLVRKVFIGSTAHVEFDSGKVDDPSQVLRAANELWVNAKALEQLEPHSQHRALASCVIITFSLFWLVLRLDIGMNKRKKELRT